ncbi:MAG TPA: hypothetical protein VH815_09150 [Acidobacteriota bacterium]
MNTSVFVDDRKLPLNPFMKSLTANVIQGIAKSLKAANGKRVEFTLQNDDLKLDVDGQTVPLDLGNAKRIVGNILSGLVKSLHGAESGEKFQFVIEE